MREKGEGEIARERERARARESDTEREGERSRERERAPGREGESQSQKKREHERAREKEKKVLGVRSGVSVGSATVTIHRASSVHCAPQPSPLNPETWTKSICTFLRSGLGCRGLDLAESHKLFRFLGCNHFRPGPRQVVTWNSSFIFGICPDMERTILKSEMDGESLVSNGPTHPSSTLPRHARSPFIATQAEQRYLAHEKHLPAGPYSSPMPTGLW